MNSIALSVTNVVSREAFDRKIRMKPGVTPQGKFFRPSSSYRVKRAMPGLVGALLALLFLLLPGTSSAQQQWFWQNPLPQGNGLRGLFAVDENLLYAVGDFGTFLKTTDGGSTWSLQPTGTAIHLRGVWFADASSGVAVGDSGTILRTTNGGASWARTSQTFDPGITFAAVCFTDANTGTVVGYPGAIYRTTDGGNTWTPQIGPPGILISSVYFTDKNTGTIVGSYGTIYRTTNGGSKWTRQVSGLEGTVAPLLLGVSFSDADRGTAVGQSGTIVHTTDGGITWTKQSSGTSFNLNAVHFLDANTGTVVGDVGMVLHTTNGGATWTQQSSGLTSWFSAVRLTSASTGIVVGSNGVVYRTVDNGSSWTLQTPGPRTALYSVAFANATTGVAAGYGGLTVRTTDGGGTWLRVSSPTTWNLWGIAFADTNTGTAVGEHSTILRTTNAGESWIDQTVPSERENLWSYAVSFGSSRRGIVTVKLDTILTFGPPAYAETRSIILRTTDGGASWARQRLPWKNLFYAICFADSVTATAVGDSGMIIHTTDGGLRWVAQNGIWSSEDSIRPITIVRLLGVSFGSLNRGIAVGDSGMILGTSDGGTTWAIQASGTTRRLNSVWMLDSNNVIAVGDSATILRTSNGGTSWSPQPVRTLNHLYALSFTAADRVTIVGEGGAIFSTTPGGLPVSVRGDGVHSTPLDFELLQNYPNPFNASTAIGYELSAPSFVTIEVFDVLGRKVATLAKEVHPAGRYTVRWDAANLASGVYLCRMRARQASGGSGLRGGHAGNFAQTKKVLLLK